MIIIEKKNGKYIHSLQGIWPNDFFTEEELYPLKKGKFIPGVNIKIQSKQKNQPKIDCVLVLAWNFFNDIRNKNKSLSDNFINIKSLEKD